MVPDVVLAYVISFEETGEPLSLGFASMFSKHALALALSDATLVGSTIIFCVPFAKALKSGWLKYDAFGIAIQHTYQTAILAVAVVWTFHQQWPWVQSGFLTLHTLVMIMKVHSYMTTNGNLARIAQDAEECETILRKETERVGGWDQAVQESLLAQTGSESTTVDHSLNGTPLLIPNGATKEIFDGSSATSLQNKLIAATNAQNRDTASSYFPPQSSSDAPTHPLVNHPDIEISNLASQLSHIEAELTSTGPEKIRWPQNVTWLNYLDYLLVPSLVYDLEFPRTERLVPSFIYFNYVF